MLDWLSVDGEVFIAVDATNVSIEAETGKKVEITTTNVKLERKKFLFSVLIFWKYRVSNVHLLGGCGYN